MYGTRIHFSSLRSRRLYISVILLLIFLSSLVIVLKWPLFRNKEVKTINRNKVAVGIERSRTQASHYCVATSLMEEGEPELRVFESSEEISIALAEYIHQVSEAAIKERGSFSLVLSGGDIPKRLGKLTRMPFLKTVEWSKWHVFWAEENVVADKRHPDSLYMQAKEAFISKVPILPAHVVPVSHGVPADSAACSYEFSIRQRVKNRTVPASPWTDCPRFDLVLLTLGPQGNVASFYPNRPVTVEESQWVVVATSPDARRESVSLTLPVINAAANVVVVASGPDRARAFGDAMTGQKTIGPNPAQMVRPKGGKLVWFVDAGAASLFFSSKSTAATSSSWQ